MKPAEVAGIGELAGDAAAEVVLRIEDMHKGIAGRAFGATGVPAMPVKAIHDLVATGAYRTVAALTKTALRAGGMAAAAARSADAPSLEERPLARAAIGAINGAFGSALEERKRNPLAVRMAVRLAAGDLTLEPEAVRAAFPDATGRLAVFLHGLCETDDSWRLGAHRSPPYGERLRADLGYTPLMIRYNSGRHISANGRALAVLLDDLLAAWPAPVSEIALIGHSMGALVARSATHYGAGCEWAHLTRHVIALGAPHQGAQLERAVSVAVAALSRLPETRSLAGALSRRSAGIKDLRHGYLVDEDWEDYDPDALRHDPPHQIPFLHTAKHYFVGATVAPVHDSLSARLVGDLLVSHASAWDRTGLGEPLRFPVDHYRHYGGVSHFQLLNHPAVYAQIRQWLSDRPVLLTAGSDGL